MNTLKAVIEAMENNYSAYIKGIDGVVATGKSIAEVKENLKDAVKVFLESCKESNCEVPSQLKGEYTISFC